MDEIKLLNILKKHYQVHDDEIKTIHDLVVYLRHEVCLDVYHMSDDYHNLLVFIDDLLYDKITDEDYDFIVEEIKRGYDLIRVIEKEEMKQEWDEKRPFSIILAIGHANGELNKAKEMFNQEHPYSDEIVDEFKRIQEELRNLSKKIDEEYRKL